MTVAAWVLWGSLGLVVYAYAGYPLVLWLLGRTRQPRDGTPRRGPWPTISVTMIVHNEAAGIGETLESILALDYPAARRQVLVISDASTDRTEEIVTRFGDRGVELLRLEGRGGKTAAENAALPYLRGDIIINTDSSVRVHPAAAKLLVAQFADPTVGVASGRDVSVARLDSCGNAGESRYVEYEMWVRALETRVSGIVGASGCLYAVRATLQQAVVPAPVSRDFAAVLLARERGYRSVAVNEAVCFVPRAASLRREYFRKVRTMTRGLETLLHKRRLINPLRYGGFAWMLLSHKLCRWLVPWALLLGIAALGRLAITSASPRWALACVVALAAVAVAGWMWSQRHPVPGLLRLPVYVLMANVAALHAWVRALRRDLAPIWEPTRREPAPSP